MCSISLKEAIGILFQKADLLTIDEISMGHKHVFEAIDRTMQDLRKNASPFGRLTVLLAGGWGLATNFASCATWIKDGNCGSNTESFISLAVCDQIKTDTKYEGKTPRGVVSVCGLPSQHRRWSSGTAQSKGDFFIKLPDDIIITNEKELLDFDFGGIGDKHTNSAWLAARSVICPTNSEVDAINKTIMETFPGEEKVYRSHDYVEENEHQYPVEFSNTLCPSGRLPHRLHLKKHSIIMLLRNLDPVNGHCNGTR
ncbi:fructose-bisphosphate aldolase [Elysia marginata]|uniref:ATP-dependent DNA helicase n=1 Tax=Elysia marginata TaxID=1093978 RepID=A0AAV4HGN6_9GAST|nr:fructose-bisphosphate aldolase [Elysia marginata]